MYIEVLKNIVISIILLILVDAPYLMTNSKLYENVTRKIAGRSFTSRYYSALIVYIAIAAGIVFLALPNIKNSQNVTDRLISCLKWGGIFGVTSYAVFDFTMHFMFDDWTLGIAVMDSVWGGILCTIVTFILSYLV